MKTLLVTDISLVAVLVVLKPKELILALLYLNLRRIAKTTFGFSSLCFVPSSGDFNM